MKITRESPAQRSAETRVEAGADPREALTPESIQGVRDFTARKTLEQAHALVSGLVRIHDEATADEADRALAEDLESVGITAADAEQIAREALSLMELMADRDRKAEIFHAAVKEAGQAERAMYERLAAIARVLRAKLGSRSPALAKLGVPPDADVHKARPRPPGKAIFSAVAAK
jgi:hypothetical protein